MEYQILIQAVARLGVINAPHGMGFSLRQQVETQQVNGNTRLQVLIGTTWRQRQQVQTRPVAHGPALHVFLVDDLNFDIDLFDSVEGTRNVEEGRFPSA